MNYDHTAANRRFSYDANFGISYYVSLAANKYLPSQFLCEFIKHCGFDGLLYRSSVGPGVNVALFTADKAQAGRITPYQVERVTVEIIAGKSP